MRYALALVLLAAGCHSTTSSMVGASAITAEAAAAAAFNRSQGGCIAMCTNGTVCNPRSGLCERPPCDNACGPGERCDVSFKGNQCVAAGTTGVASQAPGTGMGAVGAGAINQAPDANHASPTIVPTAEKK